MRNVKVILILAMAATAFGCAGVPRDAPGDGRALRFGDDRYDQAFEATLAALQEQGFELARHDHRFGVISTRPRRAPTLFEPWDASNSDGDQIMQATFNEMRRRVQVQIVPSKQSTKYVLKVAVTLEQRQEPTRFLDGTTSGRGTFRRLDQMPEEYARRGMVKRAWNEIGRDAGMEARLLLAIHGRMQVSPS